jgi:hypothetical protein
MLFPPQEYMKQTWALTTPWRAMSKQRLEEEFGWTVHGAPFNSWLWVEARPLLFNGRASKKKKKPAGDGLRRHGAGSGAAGQGRGTRGAASLPLSGCIPWQFSDDIV